ncbi:hypothetical protein D7X30_24435 [Corallococcus sp. AB011P]|uniref:hypothetical protein n=1 Tax=unclassified Corallococcus TaxID=2685029 RepID=UPI000EA28119|nr:MULTISPECIES: hypothetical protein [unclassified Corallococcus]RKG56156.1 hypothetical protein D7X30_24435 [Corallococcus sp. AB011P]RKH76865.1 hypothetical protein D7Y21_38110 [Corallococcus sp. AB045]
MFETPENDSISPALRALLELFATDLADVKFPDVDTAVLGESAAHVREKAEAVARVQAALDAARQELNESQESLLQKGQRALAYAKVFAEDDAELGAKLEAIHLPRPVRKGGQAQVEPVGAAPGNDDNAPRRRGRPPKLRPVANLFTDGGNGADGGQDEAAASLQS